MEALNRAFKEILRHLKKDFFLIMFKLQLPIFSAIL